MIASPTFKTNHRLAGIFEANGYALGDNTAWNIPIDVGEFHHADTVLDVPVSRFLKVKSSNVCRFQCSVRFQNVEEVFVGKFNRNED